MGALVTQIILIIIVFIIILVIYSITRAFLREKRIEKFTLSKEDVIEVSLFDKMYERYNNLINFLSKNLGDSKILTALSHDYDKYIMTFEEKYKSSMNYITIKIITTMISIILVVLLIILEALPNNLLLLFLSMILGFFIPDGIWMINYYYKCNDIIK